MFAIIQKLNLCQTPAKNKDGKLSTLNPRKYSVADNSIKALLHSVNHKPLGNSFIRFKINPKCGKTHIILLSPKFALQKILTENIGKIVYRTNMTLLKLVSHLITRLFHKC